MRNASKVRSHPGSSFLTPMAPAVLAVAVVASALNSARLGALAPQVPPAPSFEVASIKPNNSGDGRVMLGNQPGRFTATNVTLRMLIRTAYQLQDFQISGGPGWLASDHFDVVAKIEAGDPDVMPAGPPVPGQGPTRLQLMIRSLLTERFKLAVHTETKEQPIYALVVARTDGRLGQNLKQSETDCAGLMAANRGRGAGRGMPGRLHGLTQHVARYEIAGRLQCATAVQLRGSAVVES